MRNHKGITLIALIITIIVLLILAGISIAMVVGDNEILKQATSTKEETRYATIKEQKDIWESSVEIDKQTGSNDAIKASEVINKLYEDGTITEEEKNKLLNGESITVANKEIIFSEIGVKVTTLYDEINNPDDENYDENAMHIGDYVEYDAGVWENNINQDWSNSWFGSVVVGQSRNENISLLNQEWEYVDGYYPMDYQGDYSGWRIWDIADDGTITLISAGCPEYFTYVGSEWSDKRYDVELMLSGSTAGTTILDYSTPRDWSMYINSNQYAVSSRTITKADVDFWYNKYIDNTITDCGNIEMISNTENKLISTLINNFGYWIATPGEYFNEFYAIYDYDDIMSCKSFYVCFDRVNFGIRVMVTLSPDAMFDKTSEKLSENGFEYNKWIIK